MITLHLRDNIEGFNNEVIAKCSTHEARSGGVDLDSMSVALRSALKKLPCECAKSMGIIE